MNLGTHLMPDPSDALSPKVTICHGAGSITDVLFKKGGCNMMISYDEYLRCQFSKDSPDDKEFEFETLIELLDSLDA